MKKESLLEQCIQLETQSNNKESIIKEMASVLKKNPILEKVDEKQLFEALTEREKLGSTGFGKEIAIPHCRLSNISDFVLAIFTSKTGIDFDALDGKKTKIFVVIVAPSKARNEHIRLLSGISSLLGHQAIREDILNTTSVQNLREKFLRIVSDETKSHDPKESNQFTVILQKEELFEEVLTIFSEIEKCNISILTAENAGSYLYSMPLFSQFWNEEQSGYNKIIIAVMKKSYANEAIRKLNMILKKLQPDSGLLYFMQDIAYTNGNINI